MLISSNSSIFESSGSSMLDFLPTTLTLLLAALIVELIALTLNKLDERGIVIKNKARLVAQGHTQEEGIYYDKVFAPVTRIEAIRLFLAYASFKDLVVYQMDVKSFFMERLKKRGKIDKTLFIIRHQGDILLVQVYVDDIIFVSTKKELCTSFEILMHDKFQMSSIGELTFFLGLQVKQKEDDIFISQDKYVAKILKKFRFSEVKTASTPMETQKSLLKNKDGEEVDIHIYRSMIGSLIYLTSSMPDIMFAVCACARYQVNHKVSHLHAVKRIFRYLKVQPKLGLWYPKDSLFDLMAYTDSDYARASLDRISTTGGCQFFGCRLISWQCKKQTMVSNYTTEAKYVVASSCCGQERIDEIDANEDIALVSTHDDMVQDEGIEDADVPVSAAKTIVTTAATITTGSTKSNVKVTQVQDNGKGKAKLIEELVILKKKDQILFDEEVARKLQEEIFEQERLVGERATQEEEANSELIETWEDIQAKVDADYQLAERLQAKEQEQLTDVEKAKLIMDIMKKRRKLFAAKRTTEKRNKPPTKAQQRSIMNEAKTTQESSSKRAGDKLDQEISKKQKVEDDKESEELKKCLEIIPDDGDEVTIEATPLSSMSPTIVDYKIYKEVKKNYFQIFRVDGNSQMYLTFSKLLKNFDREDLEVLWRLVKDGFVKTKPIDDMDSFLLHTLKTMFEHHVEDNVWKNQQGLTKVKN
nr:hypothetical protein [Tanacetum cinerariifolium]